MFGQKSGKSRQQRRIASGKQERWLTGPKILIGSTVALALAIAAGVVVTHYNSQDSADLFEDVPTATQAPPEDFFTPTLAPTYAPISHPENIGLVKAGELSPLEYLTDMAMQVPEIKELIEQGKLIGPVYNPSNSELADLIQSSFEGKLDPEWLKVVVNTYRNPPPDMAEKMEDIMFLSGFSYGLDLPGILAVYENTFFRPTTIFQTDDEIRQALSHEWRHITDEQNGIRIGDYTVPRELWTGETISDSFQEALMEVRAYHNDVEAIILARRDNENGVPSKNFTEPYVKSHLIRYFKFWETLENSSLPDEQDIWKRQKAEFSDIKPVRLSYDSFDLEFDLDGYTRKVNVSESESACSSYLRNSPIVKKAIEDGSIQGFYFNPDRGELEDIVSTFFISAGMDPDTSPKFSKVVDALDEMGDVQAASTLTLNILEGAGHKTFSILWYNDTLRESYKTTDDLDPLIEAHIKASKEYSDGITIDGSPGMLPSLSPKGYLSLVNLRLAANQIHHVLTNPDEDFSQAYKDNLITQYAAFTIGSVPHPAADAKILDTYLNSLPFIVALVLDNFEPGSGVAVLKTPGSDGTRPNFEGRIAPGYAEGLVMDNLGNSY